MILITGATGLLGSRLLFDLLSEGKKVRALVRLPVRKDCLNNYFSENRNLLDQVDWVEGDVTDIYSLEEAMENITEVYHCAGMVSFQKKDADLLNRINIEGTANVVNICLNKKVLKLCHVSSVAALGRAGSENHIDEESVWRTSSNNTLYAISKYGAEREVWRGVAEGLNAVVVNPGIIIGPGNWKTDGSILFTRAERGLSFYTSGITGFVDVNDVSKSMITLMEKNKFGDRFILVGENLPYRNVINAIAENINVKKATIKAGPVLTGIAWRVELLKSWLLNIKPVITKETANSASKVNYYSNKKIIAETGIVFKSITESVSDTAKFYKKK